jgi:hypothetical protein
MMTRQGRELLRDGKSLEEVKKLRERELELSTAGADQSNGSTPHTAFRHLLKRWGYQPSFTF